MILCSEIIRQVLPYLSAEDSGRCLLLTSKSIIDMVGEEFVWKTMCEKHDMTLPPPTPTTTTTPSDDGRDGNFVADSINYKDFFQQRRCRTIQLASDTLVPYSTPPETTFQDWNVIVDVWCKSNNENLAISQWLQHREVQELLEQGKVTITNSNPILIKQLSKEKARGWNLPTDYSGWKARVQLFKKKKEFNHNNNEGSRKKESSTSSSAATAANSDEATTTTTHHTHHHQRGGDGAVLLDTDFTLWRPWSQFGELTFIQKDRTNGLSLSDRGQWLEYKIIRSTTTSRNSRAKTTVSKKQNQQHSKRSNWEAYLGFQCKLVFLCEPQQQQQSPSMNGDTVAGADDNNNDVVSFAFSRIRLEVIRLHENEHGNIRHYLFRPDNQGWNRHGIHLLHLIEELI